MKKKIILGSIGAVVLIVLMSFSSVVGLQGKKSIASGFNSPLFEIRTKRARNENENSIYSEYLGKGDVNIPVFKTYEDEFNQLFFGQYPLSINYSSFTVNPILCGIYTLVIILLFLPILIPLFFLEGIRTIFYRIAGIDTCYFDETCSFTCFYPPCHLGFNNPELSPFIKKIETNPHFKKLVVEHPELIPEIIAVIK